MPEFPPAPPAWWSACADCMWSMACSVGYCNKVSRSKGGDVATVIPHRDIYVRIYNRVYLITLGVPHEPFSFAPSAVGSTAVMPVMGVRCGTGSPNNKGCIWFHRTIGPGSHGSWPIHGFETSWELIVYSSYIWQSLFLGRAETPRFPFLNSQWVRVKLQPYSAALKKQGFPK